jgi:hypothetical protein
MENRVPWKDTVRAEFTRKRARYLRDLTDREWALIVPLLPPENPVAAHELPEGLDAVRLR